MAGNSWQSPVTGEPSQGTMHETADAQRTLADVFNGNSSASAGTWSAAISMINVPTGAKAAWCPVQISKAAATPVVCYEAATGHTLNDVSVGNNFMGYHFTTPPQNAGGTVRIVQKIPLDASGQFKIAATVATVAVRIFSPIDYNL